MYVCERSFSFLMKLILKAFVFLLFCLFLKQGVNHLSFIVISCSSGCVRSLSPAAVVAIGNEKNQSTS